MGARGLSKGAIVHNCDCATHQRVTMPLEISTIPGTVKGEDFQAGGGGKEWMRPLNQFVAVLWLIGILGLAACGQVRLGKNRCFMCNDSIGIAPDPRKTAEALVQIYAARAYGWRGIFAVHTWIALKPRNAKRYAVLQVHGLVALPRSASVEGLSGVATRPALARRRAGDRLRPARGLGRSGDPQNPGGRKGISPQL